MNGLKSLSLELLNTMYWATDPTSYIDNAAAYTNKDVLKEILRRFGNQREQAVEWMESNRPDWAAVSGDEFDLLREMYT